MAKALILVDFQNDFMENGSLAVPQASQALDYVLKTINIEDYDQVIFTQDWHPANHESFASQYTSRNPFDVIDLHGLKQTLWPDHCIQGTLGAAIVDQLQALAWNSKIIQKGQLKAIDSYSGFWDNDHRSKTELDAHLKFWAVSQVDIVGLALDYCVKYTAIDAAQLGYETTVLLHGTRAIGEMTTSLDHMIARGVKFR